MPLIFITGQANHRRHLKIFKSHKSLQNFSRIHAGHMIIKNQQAVFFRQRMLKHIHPIINVLDGVGKALQSRMDHLTEFWTRGA